MNVGIPYLEQIRSGGGAGVTPSTGADAATAAVTTTGAASHDDTEKPTVTGWGWVALTLTQLVAAITTGYHTEHNTDDSHRTIHASGAIYERDRVVAIGDWVDAPFSATNFAGLAAMTWTVTQAQQVALSYLRIGTTCYLNYWIEGAALGGTVSAGLKLTLPENLRIAQYASAPCYAVNGTATTARSTATPGDRFLAIFKTDNTNWSLASTVTVQGQIAIKVSDNTGDTNVLGVDPILTYTGGSINFGANTTLPLGTAGSYTLSVNRAMTLLVTGIAGGAGGTSGAGYNNAGTPGNYPGNQPAGGAGGAGGAETTGTTVALVTGKTYTLVIGAAGTGGTATSCDLDTQHAGTNGGDTTFVNTTDVVTLLALKGGGSATANVGANLVAGGLAGTGGIAVAGPGDGNPGGNAGTGAGGGGGGGAGNNDSGTAGAGQAGGTGSGATRATTGASGTGGDAGTLGTGGVGAAIAGVTGSFGGGGGGGGGAGAGGAGSGNVGGAGGAGQAGAVVITFVSAP